MTLEGLKKLKERLLEQDKYFIVPNLEELTTSYDVVRFYTEEEIVRLDNTNGIKQGCSKLLEDLAYYFIPNFDNVSQIALSSMSSPLISKSILEDKIIDNDTWTKSDQDKIAKYFMDGYAFVDFDLSECCTIIGKDELCNLSDIEKYNKICNYLKSIIKNYNTSGFVKYDDFAKAIQSLGYDISLYPGVPAKTFEDYKENCFGFSSLNIIANLEKSKVKTK